MFGRKQFTVIFLLVFGWVSAQTDTISLREVLIPDAALLRYSQTRQEIKVKDTAIATNRQTLGGFLQFNTPVYIKENGFGGVASPSFRGTTAQQTAVIWNGININSQFNGQTDFNTVNFSDASSVTVRSGGGSVLYGTGAIGGSVHLNNELKYGDHFDNRLFVNYGSFNTQNVNYRVDAGSKKWSVQAIASYNRSDNDYPFVDSRRHNLNGQYYNTGLNIASGVKLNARNVLNFYGQISSGTRHFSLLFPSETKTKYADDNLRSVLEWQNYSGRLTSRTRVAFLDENYRYFPTLSETNPSFGHAKTVLAKYDGSYRIGSRFFVNAIVDYNKVNGEGSDVRKTERNVGSGALLGRFAGERFVGEIGVKKEISNDYESPVLFSGGVKYRITKNYVIRINTSKNFRIPTFNDLYWGQGGNPDLKPETSWQVEFGQELKFTGFSLAVSGYYMKVDDMIQWIPGGNGNWFPQNLNKAEMYGIEAILSAQKNTGIGKFSFNGTYSYTISQNEETGNQLIYVPIHKGNASVSWEMHRFFADVQSMYNGEVFTRGDNNRRYNLDGYMVVNGGIGFYADRKKSVAIRARVNNVFDQEYFTMVDRPYPGRYYQASLTLKL